MKHLYQHFMVCQEQLALFIQLLYKQRNRILKKRCDYKIFKSLFLSSNRKLDKINKKQFLSNAKNVKKFSNPSICSNICGSTIRVIAYNNCIIDHRPQQAYTTSVKRNKKYLSQKQCELFGLNNFKEPNQLRNLRTFQKAHINSKKEYIKPLQVL